MKLKLTLIIIVAILILAVCSARSAVAAESEGADVIVLDDSCRLIKKPAAKTLKKSTLRVDYNRPKPKAKPPAPAASAASAPVLPKPRLKPKPKPAVTVLPQRDIPDEYELNCDDAPPPFSLFPPPAEFTPVPFVPIEDAPWPEAPPLYVVPTLPPVDEITEPPTTFVGITTPPTYIFVGPPSIAPPTPVPVPPNPIPEPATLPMIVFGLAAIVIWRARRPT